MVKKIISAALIGAALYKAAHLFDGVGLTSPEKESMIYHIREYKKKHPSTKKTDTELFQMFLPKRLKRK